MLCTPTAYKEKWIQSAEKMTMSSFWHLGSAILSGENCVGKPTTPSRSVDLKQWEGGYEVKKIISLVCNM